MKSLKSWCLSTFAIALCLTSFHANALADEGVDRIVSEIIIMGNDTVSEQTILGQIRTSAGQPMSPQLLSDDLKRLYGLGYFKDVEVKQNIEGSQVKIAFIVQEKEVLSEVIIKGNTKIKTSEIEKVVKAKVGDFFDQQAMRRDVNAIKKLYEDKGFYDATISHQVDYDTSTNQAALIFNVREGTKLIVKSIEFEGAYWLEAKQIRKVIESKTVAWWGLVSGALKDDVLEMDLQRIRALYDEHGFSDAKVSYRLDDAVNPGEVVLVFEVEEGRQYLVGEIEFRGQEIFTEDEILQNITLLPDTAFSRKGLRESVSNIQDMYFEKGYMNAKVAFDSILNDKTGRVDTSYSITENNITTVNQVVIKGNSKTKDVVIRRELRVYPGEPFNGAQLKYSKERLFNLGFFEDIQFDTQDTAHPDSKDLVVTVTETKTGEFSFGGGFSSIDKAVGFVQIRQRNFDVANWPNMTGAGQDLALRVQLGSVRSQGELSWTDPWFMGYPFSLGFDLYKRELDRTRSSGLFFDEDREGARLRLGKDLTDFDRLDYTYGFETVDISAIPSTASADLRAEEGENDLSRSSLFYTRDMRDSKILPTEGYLFQGGGEYVGGFLGGDKDFWRVTGLASGYWEQWTDIILELKLRGGIAEAFDETNKVPIFERFYAGGANTIRGYRERRIGPRDTGTQDPIGGDAYWVGNAEYTFPLVEGIIKGAAFYDLGSVEADKDDFASGDVYSGVGLGLRVNTPIGPVQLDAGYPLDDVDGEDKEIRFYFNMSRGF